jgi:hypothetical protein
MRKKKYIHYLGRKTCRKENTWKTQAQKGRKYYNTPAGTKNRWCALDSSGKG